MREQCHVGMPTADFAGVIRAATIDDDDASGPSKLLQRSSDIGGLVVRQNNRRDVIKHAGLIPCCLGSVPRPGATDDDVQV